MKPSDRVKKGIVLSRERHPVFPESSVLENLKIAGYLRKRAEIQETMGMIFELFPALVQLKNRKAGFLKAGNNRCWLSAWPGRPPRPLLDEPLLGLSPVMQKVLVEGIASLKNRSGITVLLSEQFARPVLPMIDRGYIIENGMLTLSGTGDELMDNPEVKSAYFGV
jgi:branched-chain amino acid transport system ATP-binding protein